MPNTDTITYLMYKTMRGGLADIRDSLDETLHKEFNKVSDKGTPILRVIDLNKSFVAITK